LQEWSHFGGSALLEAVAAATFEETAAVVLGSAVAIGSSRQAASRRSSADAVVAATMGRGMALEVYTRWMRGG